MSVVVSKKIILGVAIAVPLLALIVWAVVTQLKINQPIDGSSSKNSSLPNATSDIKTEYSHYYGEAFDEQYIAGMLAHHEGAVNMAEQAMASAEKPEIKKMSEEIIQTQSQEMMQMNEWQEEWNYEKTYSGGHGSHGGGGSDMAGDMVEMQNKLKDKKGKAYDKEFLTQMILHHSQAIEMSRPAETNASHAELKKLAREVILAQEKEIAMMQQWQKEWGY